MYFQVMGLHESFKDADDRDDTNDSSIGTPGDLTDGRATLVPPSGFTHLQVMKDLHKCVVTNKSGPESPRFRGKIPPSTSDLQFNLIAFPMCCYLDVVKQLNPIYLSWRLAVH